MASEIELKLELSASDAEAVVSAAFLPGDPETIDQTSVYFDTPDRDLQHKGMCLRIRDAHGKRTQTVKADGAGAAGLFVRSEWECAVEDDTPVLDDTTPVRAMLGPAIDTIAPLFEVRVARAVWMVEQDDARIELVLDRGEAVVDDRTAPICEIELELKSGNPAVLFNLARHIDQVVPVRLGVQTKSERGYRLTGPVSTMFKAEPVMLTSAMTAGQAFRKVVGNCVRQFRLNEHQMLSGRNVEALHQARVGLRRLRSGLAIFKPLIGGESQVKLGAELRWLASNLGDARNLDVMLERAPPGALHDRLQAAGATAHARVADALATPRARALMLDLAEWTARGDWLGIAATQEDRDQPVREYAVSALGRIRRKLRQHGRDLAQANDDARHRVRKYAKKLRYAAEFFAPLFERKREQHRYRKFMAALEELQDVLGSLNDLATAPLVLTELGLADDDEASMLIARGSKRALIKAATRAHENLIEAKPFWR